MADAHHPEGGRHNPKVDFAQRFVIHAPANFGIPEVDGGDEGEGEAAKDGGMEVGKVRRPPQSVPSQLKNLTPVGTATSKVEIMKGTRKYSA